MFRFSKPFSIFYTKKTFSQKVRAQNKKFEPELRELVIKRKTAFSIISFAIGTVLIGNFAWHLLSTRMGIWATGLLGLTLFVVGGVLHREFRK
ncbi:MAG: hypothetical protein COU65_03395 [Candidatus Pacebacteria bacterium CG10_big_fil_rev_8_21_14_0_10_42_12]|nr:MAG: hypothetical protein COU65_03395 [Candidatus Pacebacteria bacterium CG10_big_fil_rev_8_21_14_0_10_42_12]